MKSKKLDCNGVKEHNASTTDSGPSSSSIGSKEVTLEEIEYVQNLIERCLVLYMTKDEAIAMLLEHVKIDEGFLHLVWQQLEVENPEFFKAYAIRLELKKQIITFNELLEKQYHMMHNHSAMQPSLNYSHSNMHANSSIGIPAEQLYPPLRAGTNTNQWCNGSTNHIVNAIPIRSNFNSSLQNGVGINTNQWCNGSINHMVNGIPIGSNFYSSLPNGNAASNGQQGTARGFNTPSSEELYEFLIHALQPSNCSAEGSNLNATNLINWEAPESSGSHSDIVTNSVEYPGKFNLDCLNADSSSPETQMQTDKEK